MANNIYHNFRRINCRLLFRFLTRNISDLPGKEGEDLALDSKFDEAFPFRFKC